MIMNLLTDFTLPAWIPTTLITAGMAFITSLSGLVTTFVKQRIAKKLAAQTAAQQLTLLQTMVTKLTDMAALSVSVTNISTKMTDVLTSVQNSIADQKTSNTSLATFVMQCFQLSNLSDENKLQLKTLCNQLFYGDSVELVDTLKKEILQISSNAADKVKETIELQQQVAQLQTSLNETQANVKTSRRII